MSAIVTSWLRGPKHTMWHSRFYTVMLYYVTWPNKDCTNQLTFYNQPFYIVIIFYSGCREQLNNTNFYFAFVFFNKQHLCIYLLYYIPEPQLLESHTCQFNQTSTTVAIQLSWTSGSLRHHLTLPGNKTKLSSDEIHFIVKPASDTFITAQFYNDNLLDNCIHLVISIFC